MGVDVAAWKARPTLKVQATAILDPALTAVIQSVQSLERVTFSEVFRLIAREVARHGVDDLVDPGPCREGRSFGIHLDAATQAIVRDVARLNPSIRGRSAVMRAMIEAYRVRRLKGSP